MNPSFRIQNACYSLAATPADTDTNVQIKSAVRDLDDVTPARARVSVRALSLGIARIASEDYRMAKVAYRKVQSTLNRIDLLNNFKIQQQAWNFYHNCK